MASVSPRGSRYEVGDEPVPGYRLEKWIGEGAMGEVWQASSAGGIKVALKIIYRLDQRGGRKEFRSLQLIKNINHPNLAKVFAFWLKDAEGRLLESLTDPSILESDTLSAIQFQPRHKRETDGNSKRDTQVDPNQEIRGTLMAGLAGDAGHKPAELIIAMGLGEATLFDLLEEYQAQGKQGIPFDELIGYLESAAQAIDFLNTHHKIQHCDIKPSNILVVGGSTQVCDFGLAKSVHDTRKTTTAFTVAYGAPELDKGQQNWTTDQYSLAITYVELLTGKLPFPGENIAEVVRAKLTGALDLSALPESDRAVVRKATDLDPQRRHKSCAEFVKKLKEGRLSRREREAMQAGAPGRRAKSGRGWSRVLMAAAVLGLLTLVAAAFVFPDQRAALIARVREMIQQPLPPPPDVDLVGLDAELDQELKESRFAAAAELLAKYPEGARLERWIKVSRAWRGEAQKQRDAGELISALETCQRIAEKLQPPDAEAAALRAEVLSRLLAEAARLERDQQPDQALAALENLRKHLQATGGMDRQTWPEVVVRIARLHAQRESWSQVAAALREASEHRDWPPDLAARYATLSVLAAARQAPSNPLPAVDWEQVRVMQQQADGLPPWEEGMARRLLTELSEGVTTSWDSLAPPLRQRIRDVFGDDLVLVMVMSQVRGLLAQGQFEQAMERLSESAKEISSEPGRRQVAQMRLVVSLSDTSKTAEAAVRGYLPVAERDGVPAVLMRALVRRLELEAVGQASAAPLLQLSVARSLFDLAKKELAPAEQAQLQRRLLALEVLVVMNQPALDYENLERLSNQILSQGGTGDAVMDALMQCAVAEGRSARGAQQQLSLNDWLDLERNVSAAEQKLVDSKIAAFAAYGKYVRAVVKAASRNPDEKFAVQAMMELSTDPPEILKQPERARRAQKVLLDSLTGLQMPDDRTFASLDAAAQQRFALAAERMSSAARFGELDSAEARAYQAMALVYRHGPDRGQWPEPDWRAALEISDRLLDDPEAARELETGGLIVQTQLVNALAGALAASESRQAADWQKVAARFAQIVRRVETARKAGKPTVADPRLYEQLVTPALELLGSLPASSLTDAARQDLAELYFFRAKLVRRSDEVAELVGKNDEAAVAQSAYDSLHRANQLRPTAESLVEEGRALIDLPAQDQLVHLQQLEDLATQAKQLNAQCAGAYGLLGYVYVNRSRGGSATIQERLASLDKAVQSLGDAIRLPDGDQQKPVYLADLSAAHLESAYWTSRQARQDPDVGGEITPAQREHLDKAVLYAQQAIDLSTDDSFKENALNALGNAYEDKAYYLKEYENYAEAQRSFQSAYDLAHDHFRSGAKALFNLGRSRYRWAEDSASLSPGDKRKKLTLALADLQDATRLTKDGHRKAEILHWMMFANASLAAGAAEAERKQYLEAADRSGEDAANTAKQVNSPLWPDYQYGWALFALRNIGPEAAQRRANALIEESGSLRPSVDMLQNAVTILVKTQNSITDQIEEIGKQLHHFPPDNPATLEAHLFFLKARCDMILDQANSPHEDMCEQDLIRGQMLAERLMASDEAKGREYSALFLGGAGILHAQQARRDRKVELYWKSSRELAAALEGLKDKPVESTVVFRIRLAITNKELLADPNSTLQQKTELVKAGVDALEKIKESDLQRTIWRRQYKDVDAMRQFFRRLLP